MLWRHRDSAFAVASCSLSRKGNSPVAYMSSFPVTVGRRRCNHSNDVHEVSSKSWELNAVRVRQDRNGLRLYRYDEHPNVTKRGQHPVQREFSGNDPAGMGCFSRMASNHELQPTMDLKCPCRWRSRFSTEEAICCKLHEVSRPHQAQLQRLQLGEGQPITVKYPDRVGEILLANPGLPV